MESKNCTQSNIEKHINNFYKKYSECTDNNSKGGLKRYYEKTNKRSNQQYKLYEKNRDKILQKQNDRYIKFKKLLRSYVELENTLKA